MKEKKLDLPVKRLLENVAAEVKAARLAKNQSVEEFAENCNLSREALRDIENAKPNMDLHELFKICKYLRIEFKTFLKEVEKKSPYSPRNAGKTDTSALTRDEYIEYMRITVIRNIENCQMIFNEDLEELAKNSKTTVMSALHSDPRLTDLVRIANYVQISLRDFFRHDRIFSRQEQKIEIHRLSRAIAEQVTAFRVGQNESAGAFAKRCGIRLPRLKWIEMGRGSPNLTTLIKLACSMDVPPAEFFRRAEERAKEIHSRKGGKPRVCN